MNFYDFSFEINIQMSVLHLQIEIFNQFNLNIAKSEIQLNSMNEWKDFLKRIKSNIFNNNNKNNEISFRHMYQMVTV